MKVAVLVCRLGSSRRNARTGEVLKIVVASWKTKLSHGGSEGC